MAVIEKASQSLAAMSIDVKSETVVLWICVPLEIATPEVLIEFPEVGIAVPPFTRHVATVAVPVLTAISQALMVQANGTWM
jgi:hypothetical protein